MTNSKPRHPAPKRPTARRSITKAASKKTSAKASKTARAAEPNPLPVNASKLDRITALLKRPEGASLSELCTATGWQSHSMRGALAGTIKRKGHIVTSDKADGQRRYRIAVQP